MTPSLEQNDRAALDRRTRLWQIDQLRDELTHKRGLVERLTPQIEDIGTQLRLLGQVQDLSASLSPDIAGSGGARARDQIVLACAAGVKGLNQRRDRLKRQLNAATEVIPTLEAQLTQFQQ